MSKGKFYDENGKLCLSEAVKLAVNGDLEAVDAVLQGSSGSLYDSSIVCAARDGNLVVRNHLYNNVDKKAYLDCVLSLATDKVVGATEAIIKRGDIPECWEALWILALRHDDVATEYILKNTLREGGLIRAITLAERADPAAKEYIRDFAGLIRFADNGVPNATSVLNAHKDYNLECRERILRLCRKGK